MSLPERPLRVLFIGNIANNSYYFAKFLRSEGVEADVLCYDDYWVMSSPEWEEADFEGVPADLFFPDWTSLDLKGYERPRWFAQGPFALSVDYLRAKQEGRRADAERGFRDLSRAREFAARPATRQSMKALGPLKRFLPARVASVVERRIKELLAPRRAHTATPADPAPFLSRCHELADEFRQRFPERPDLLTLSDSLQYQQNVLSIVELFRHYDVVQGSAVDPLYPMLARFQPYTAFEHGTLRHAPEALWAYKGPFHDAPLSRLTALSYALAGHVFISNADCLESARRLRLSSFEPMPHPMDENDFLPPSEPREAIRNRRGGQLSFFCPIRHDWVDKGTDRYIRAIPELARALETPFTVCFTPWGKEIERSKQLIRELGCEDRVRWVGPFGRVQLARRLRESDVVFDQLAYPSFSGLTPRALSCGTPVIAAYEPAGMAWMFSEAAPVLAARSVDDLVRQTLRAIDPGFARRYRTEARTWIERHHSRERVVRALLGAYERLVASARFKRERGIERGLGSS